MSIFRSPRLVPVVLLIVAPWAAATPLSADNQAQARANPLDAMVGVPPVTYESAFAGYRSYGDAELRSWKAANDEVGRIGGWRSYAREASESATSAPPAAASKPTDSSNRAGDPAKPQGHGAHKSH